MHPSYRTIVYLGTRLQEIREQSIIKGSVNFSDFITTAPKTLRIIADMPYLNDQYQKQLLRGFTGSPIRFPEGPPLDPGNNPKVKLNLPPLGTPFEPPTRPEVNPYEEESSKEESSEDSPELKTPMWHLYNMKAGWNAASVPNPNRDAMPFNPRDNNVAKHEIFSAEDQKKHPIGFKNQEKKPSFQVMYW
ncbi:uncharacterized protein N7511_006728 [Penicillium nucicola]|uniref:uncharacterized protein n=1 Tax=Penicillium nucicola TaxID=1850975 RepID=UPI002544E411|nr:uncharacterized protein N7511_006728 [Penicillium nucicola]KAJ5758034.1 hypothetical protein N7511_006728 [Penicillium nucicola]